VAAGQQGGLGNPYAIFILPELHFREWNDHNGHKVTPSASDVKEAMFPRRSRPRLNLSTPWRGEAKRRRLNPQPSEWPMSFQNGNVPKSCRASVDAEIRPLHLNVSRRFWCIIQTYAHEKCRSRKTAKLVKRPVMASASLACK
jgi:hypothetical protein